MNECKLTWRERLADWISDGAVTDAKACAAFTIGPFTNYSLALHEIYSVTKDGKSDTDKKVARIAKEALK